MEILVLFETGMDVTQCQESITLCLVSLCIASTCGSDLMHGSLLHQFELIIIF